jgi:pimeloyl-ACP methyl ester carboxylesterase
MERLLVPGLAAQPALYRRVLGPGWAVHQPPSFRSRARFETHVAALCARLARAEAPTVVVGHSLGAAVAVAAAASSPHLVAGLVLLAPAGMPLTKPIRASLADFRRQARAGVYPWRQIVSPALDALLAPRATFRFVRAVRDLDLRRELELVRGAHVPCEVVGCAGDTLTPVGHCKRIADLAGARFREVSASGGHMWPLIEPAQLVALVH